MRRAALAVAALIAAVPGAAVAASCAGVEERVLERTSELEGSVAETIGSVQSKLVAQAVERADRYQEPVSLLMADIDHFKAVNDEHGHLAGDALLRQLAGVLTDSVRSVDAVGRYGGEEFVMLLPHTGYEEARRLAERIRARVQSCAFRVGERTHRMTLSLGVFSCPSPIVSTAADLVREADRALYRAKGTGRNRVK